jgi:RNase H-fold protein (predicted Holliday junction resolvase)
MANLANKVLLGISPGTRVIGLAVLRNGELVEWKVKSFKETWSKDKRKAILSTISRLCEYHSVKILVLKKINPLKSSPQLDKLLVAIIQQAERERIKVVQYSLEDLDYDMRTGKKQTKDSISENVVTKHPQLRLAYVREQNNRKEYYTKMFEAIAMAERYRG